MTLAKFIQNNVTYEQLSLDNLLSNSYHDKTKGWENLNLSDEYKKELVNGLISVLGGRQKTKDNIYHNIINNHVRTFGILQRLWAEIDKNGEIKFVYCAGQDYTGELAYIRKYLSK